MSNHKFRITSIITYLLNLVTNSAFYDGNVNARGAGDFLMKTVVPLLKSKCPGKKIIITECVHIPLPRYHILTDGVNRTGWPSRGGSNRNAVASPNDEREALLNLNCAARDDRGVSIYAFEADDQLWKGNDNERSFGIFTKINFKGDINNIC